MPQPFVITGNVEFVGNEELLEGRIEAYDRDLPSREQQGLAPQLLGQSPFTGAGRPFRIEFTDETFSQGEGETVFLRRASKFSPDLSFRVFDASGQEMTIIRIVAQNREYRPDQIIFNAPSSLEGVEIAVAPAPAPEVGDSEYERLVAIIAPVIEGIPLTDLTEDDVVFLINELGLEQQLDTQQHIQWLRRSALLASQTEPPLEAFYGWGRLSIPYDFARLVEVPLDDMPSVLNRVSALEDAVLSQTLQTAIAEKIISDLGDRSDDIIRQLRRRNQISREIVVQLLDAETGVALAGYTVTTFDVMSDKENLGLDITDNNGKFLVSFYVSRDLPQDAPARRLSFQATTPDGVELPEGEPEDINLNNSRADVVLVSVTVPRLQAPSLETLQRDGQLEIPAELLTYLRAQGINTFTDIRRKGGLSRLADLPQVNPTAIRNLESLADLNRISLDVQVNVALLDKYDSVLAIADAPFFEFVSIASRSEIGLTALKAAQLHINARTQTDLLNNLLAEIAANQANGFNLTGGVDNA